MIPIALKPEPPEFHINVRVPGKNYLRQVPSPTGDQFKRHAYWKVALPKLRTSYGSICAYSSLWVPTDCSVDHFHPKSLRPDLAYEWNNYRLAHSKINSYKGNSVDVLDPLHIQVGWFVLDFATLSVNPESSLNTQVSAAVQKTIDVLKLNDDTWVEARLAVFRSYWDGEVTLNYLQRRYPFIASEIARQGVQPRATQQQTSNDRTPQTDSPNS